MRLETMTIEDLKFLHNKVSNLVDNLEYPKGTVDVDEVYEFEHKIHETLTRRLESKRAKGDRYFIYSAMGEVGCIKLYADSKFADITKYGYKDYFNISSIEFETNVILDRNRRCWPNFSITEDDRVLVNFGDDYDENSFALPITAEQYEDLKELKRDEVEKKFSAAGVHNIEFF